MARCLKKPTFFLSLESLQVDMNGFTHISAGRWSFLALIVEEWQQILYSIVYKRAY